MEPWAQGTTHGALATDAWTANAPPAGTDREPALQRETVRLASAAVTPKTPDTVRPDGGAVSRDGKPRDASSTPSTPSAATAGGRRRPASPAAAAGREHEKSSGRDGAGVT